MIPRKRGKTVRMAKRLRREMSPAEVFLWQHLLNQGTVKIRRDHPFGPYALDFYCAKAKLAIEVDGIVHDMGDHPKRDVARDAYVAANGVETLRIAARDVLKNSQVAADAVVRMCLARMKPDNTQTHHRQTIRHLRLPQPPTPQNQPGSSAKQPLAFAISTTPNIPGLRPNPFH